MKITSGGQIKSLELDKKVLDINIMFDKGIQLWINESSLSYLTIEEGIKLRNMLNNALMKAVMRSES